MYELVFFLPLFKVYGTCLDNLRLSSNYLGGEMLQTAGVAYSSVNSQTQWRKVHITQNSTEGRDASLNKFKHVNGK